MENLTAEAAERTKHDCVCSACWGPLVTYNRKGIISISCPKHPEAGFITKSFSDTARANSRGELAEAHLNLSATLGLTTSKSAKEILSEMGF